MIEQSLSYVILICSNGCSHNRFNFLQSKKIEYVSKCHNVTFQTLSTNKGPHLLNIIFQTFTCLCASPRARVMAQKKQVKYDVFLTHDWGLDQLNRNNHKRVSEVNRQLKEIGYETWFDDERMQGDVHADMCVGIDDSEVVVVFLTSRYIKKVNSSDQRDNCRLEFNYAFNNAKKFIPVLMEPAAKTELKVGNVGLKIGASLYVEMSEEYNVSELVAVLKKGDVNPRHVIVDTSFKNIQPPHNLETSLKIVKQLDFTPVAPISIHKTNFSRVRDGGWSGEMQDSLPTGTGVWKGDKGKGRYNGGMVDGEFSGRGIFEFSDGTKMDGEFAKDVISDASVLFIDQSTYVGGIKPFKPRESQSADLWKDGYGKEKLCDGSAYEGEYQDGRKHGKGVETLGDESEKYTGMFFGGLRHGRGLLEYSNGGSYDGEFQAGKKHGKGSEIYSDGTQYIGCYENDERYGIGKLLSPEYKVLEDGMYRNGKLIKSSEEVIKVNVQKKKIRVIIFVILILLIIGIGIGLWHHFKPCEGGS